jgi:hypothetical protein
LNRFTNAIFITALIAQVGCALLFLVEMMDWFQRLA